ncbi:isopenicillin N synthase family dioxygenase [Dongia sp.]|uniref:isopenicillin N synthase family dioxygenase n=1 Tax=Dongia sp. TaxID=1977262 RepID=UPI0035B182A2
MGIPLIDISALSGPAGKDRDAVDAAILEAASGVGFMLVKSDQLRLPLDALLRIFTLPAKVTRQLWRQKFKPDQANVYRGWFPLQNGHATYKEGFDAGPDIAYGPERVVPGDPLGEATPLPPDHLLPGWRAEMASYYKEMEQTGETLLKAIARGLGQPEDVFVPAFTGGISTLRLLHYPMRPPESYVGVNAGEIRTEHEGTKVGLVGKAHADSGFVTLLAQHGIPGLQALDPTGKWVDVPPIEGTLTVNFGKLLERWTGGRIKATQHRVIASESGQARHSVPFFYEPRIDAEIAPLQGLGGEFSSFFYGDHVWAAMMRFVEFEGLDHLRPQTWKAAS